MQKACLLWNKIFEKIRNDYLGASFVQRQYKRYERTIGTYYWCTKLLAVSGTTSDEVSTIDFVFGKEKTRAKW